MPGVELVALCSCEVDHCSICVSNALISSDIMLRIIVSMFMVPGELALKVAVGVLETAVEAWCLFVRWQLLVSDVLDAVIDHLLLLECCLV